MMVAWDVIGNSKRERILIDTISDPAKIPTYASGITIGDEFIPADRIEFIRREFSVSDRELSSQLSDDLFAGLCAWDKTRKQRRRKKRRSKQQPNTR